jgi:hypothetical protein
MRTVVQRVTPLRIAVLLWRDLAKSLHHRLKNHVSPVQFWPSAQSTFASEPAKPIAPALARGATKPLLKDVARLHARRLYRIAELHDGLNHTLLTCPRSRALRLKAFALDDWASRKAR